MNSLPSEVEQRFLGARYGTKSFEEIGVQVKIKWQ